MSDASRNLERAASCYNRLGMTAEAARCFRDAGSFRRAADLHTDLGRYRAAAADYVQAGERDLAAWLLVHLAEDPAAARATLEPLATTGDAPVRRSLRQRLVLTRCDVATGAPERRVLPVLTDACHYLIKPAVRSDPYIEPWAVGLAEAIRREDQVALVFAAAVRGARPGAERRWAQWSREVLHAELILPPPERPSVTSGRG